MKYQVYLHIAARIVILMVIGMLLTYVPDYLRPFFGDTLCPDGWCGGIDVKWDWGARHYWYFWGVVSLFILSLVNFIVSIVNIIKRYYPNL